MSWAIGSVRGSSPSPAERRGSRRSGIAATLATRRTRLHLELAHNGDTGQDYARLWRTRLAPDGSPIGEPELLAYYLLDEARAAHVD